MMSFMNEALDTLMNKVDRISKTGEIVDFHRLLHKVTVLKNVSCAEHCRALFRCLNCGQR